MLFLTLLFWVAGCADGGTRASWGGLCQFGYACRGARNREPSGGRVLAAGRAGSGKGFHQLLLVTFFSPVPATLVLLLVVYKGFGLPYGTPLPLY